MCVCVCVCVCVFAYRVIDGTDNDGEKPALQSNLNVPGFSLVGFAWFSFPSAQPHAYEMQTQICFSLCVLYIPQRKSFAFLLGISGFEIQCDSGRQICNISMTDKYVIQRYLNNVFQPGYCV